jgi:hypothetical protein
LEDAIEILDAAERAVRSGQTLTDMAILIGRNGSVYMIAEPQDPLESLQREHGAATAYHVTTERDKVRVDGRAGARRCCLESRAAAAPLLGNLRIAAM